MADSLVLCHAAERETVHGYGSFSLPNIQTYTELYEKLATPVKPATVIAGALNTKNIEDDAIAAAKVETFGHELDAPASDPLRFGVEPIVDAIERELLEVDRDGS
jgi:uncharacterized NAD-dependent epimerase/dehydratase family protein